MGGPSAARALRAPAMLLAATTAGVVLLSGSDQPVTAQSYSHWQELPPPPLTARTHALGVPAHHRVLVLGGVGADASAPRDGAAYDLRTGIWHRIHIPTSVTDRDAAVVAAGVAVLRHRRPGRPAAWWRYDLGRAAWSKLHGVPPRLSPPSAFGSEVYALSGRRVVVYSVQLDRWTPLPPDPLRPVLVHRTVTASRAGTVVTGYAGPRRRPVADRWDGLRWTRMRSTAATSVTAPPNGATRVRVGGRTLVVRGGRAWIRLP